MATFPKMADILPEGTSGNVTLKHVEVTEADSKFTALRAMFNGGRDSYVPAGTYVHLYVGGELMMSDTLMEKKTNREVLYRARGHVLIAGLGLGMILHPIAAKSDVTKITVVEKSPDVVKLVGASLPKKVEVVTADIFDWTPEKGTKFDALYFDIWPSITTSNLAEMTTLHARFRKFRATGSWVDSWCRDELKALKRKAQRGVRW